MNLIWLDGQKLNYNEHVDEIFFMVKSLKMFYFIQYNKNAFHNELFLSVYSFIQMELHSWVW